MPGPPAGNTNALKNGTRTQIMRLNIGEFPANMRRQLSHARAYRRSLEAEVADIKGEVDLQDAHHIDEAVAAELHAAACRWLLRDRWNEMSVQDVRACSAEILKSKTIRNR